MKRQVWEYGSVGVWGLVMVNRTYKDTSSKMFIFLW